MFNKIINCFDLYFWICFVFFFRYVFASVYYFPSDYCFFFSALSGQVGKGVSVSKKTFPNKLCHLPFVVLKVRERPPVCMSFIVSVMPDGASTWMTTSQAYLFCTISAHRVVVQSKQLVIVLYVTCFSPAFNFSQLQVLFK